MSKQTDNDNDRAQGLMSGEEIAEVRARCDAATEGPWSALELTINWYINPTDNKHDFVVAKVGRDKLGYALPHAKGNAEFIAHARQDIPRLLAHIAALEAERDALAAMVDNFDRGMS